MVRDKSSFLVHVAATKLPRRAIDGKHIRILHPPCTGSDYFNYKGYFSLVLMAVVGPHAEFIFPDV